jgi:hypothetical protein
VFTDDVSFQMFWREVFLRTKFACVTSDVQVTLHVTEDEILCLVGVGAMFALELVLFLVVHVVNVVLHLVLLYLGATQVTERADQVNLSVCTDAVVTYL